MTSRILDKQIPLPYSLALSGECQDTGEDDAGGTSESHQKGSPTRVGNRTSHPCGKEVRQCKGTNHGVCDAQCNGVLSRGLLCEPVDGNEAKDREAKRKNVRAIANRDLALADPTQTGERAQERERLQYIKNNRPYVHLILL